MRIPIAIIDDEPPVLHACKLALGRDYEVAAFASADEYLASAPSVEALPHKLAIVDLGLSGTPGVELVRLLRAAKDGPKVLVQTGHGERETVLAIMQHEPDGYLLKPGHLPLNAAVEQVLAGDCVLSPAVARILVREVGHRGRTAALRCPVDVCLSTREREVLGLLSDGTAGNLEIAGKLGISINTVETHIRHIYAKLEVTGDASPRTRAVAVARLLGILPALAAGC